jgi:hypothetical protein
MRRRKHGICARGELDVTDNNFLVGWTIIAMEGDVTGPNVMPDAKLTWYEDGKLRGAIQP